MPKVNKIQASFSAGEISKSVYGRVDNERYDMAMAGCLNYLPIIQGPLVRRPGTKFVTYAKDPTKPPFLIPFQFSASQNYMLEFGDKYIRFYTNEGQVITSSNSFKLTGAYSLIKTAANTIGGGMQFVGVRSSGTPGTQEIIYSSSIVAPGSILEIPSWYAWPDASSLKWAQKQDTIYLTHPNYPVSKLIRTSGATWELKQVQFQDGPYLNLNTYQTIADGANICLNQIYQANSSQMTVFASNAGGYIANLSSVVIVNSARVSVTASGPHGFATGDNVFLGGIDTTGLSGINSLSDGNNNLTNSAASFAYYTIQNALSTTFDIVGGPFIGVANSTYPIPNGIINPALLKMVSNPSGGAYWADIQIASSVSFNQLINGAALRTIGLIGDDGIRRYGQISAVTNTRQFTVTMGPGQILPLSVALGSTLFWQMGVYNFLNGFPTCTCFHQDRLAFAGAAGAPQELDASMNGAGNYEVFSASGSTLQVANNNALQFNLNSQDQNAIKWLKSNAQGMLAGTANSEWSITANTQTPALTPTNINAQQVSFFGSYDSDSISVNNAIVYVQKSQNKIRELLYFWQIGNFRSTNISELAEHLANPGIQKLVNQKEPHPTIWGLRSDGQLTTLTYTRDDVTFQTRAGWARQQLGGQFDSAGSAPIINSMGTIPSGDGTYDELWLAVRRYISGSNVCTIEYMTRPYRDTDAQEFAYHFDCGSTYNSSIVVTQISSTGGSATVITSPNHGLSNSSLIRFYNTIGMNVSTVDADGNVGSSNIFNEKVFVVTSVSTNHFFVQDCLGNYVNVNSASLYVGSAVIRQLVSSISGLGWLAGDTVSVLGDGAIMGSAVVSAAGVLTLPEAAAVVSVGYPYNSDGQLLRTKDGSAQGSSIGSMRRVNRVAFMLHNVGEISFGSSFQKLIPAELYTSANLADTAAPLFDGIYRDGIEAPYDFTDTVCFRQNSGLPGMVQAIVRFFEEFDV